MAIFKLILPIFIKKHFNCVLRETILKNNFVLHKVLLTYRVLPHYLLFNPAIRQNIIF
jgi:hypothetical protein